MTADGIAVGTVDYMSPEQACGREVDGRSDIYSLGCAMFHLITGQHVFTGESKVDRMLARVEGTPRLLSEFVKDLPRGLEAVMERMLARDPNERYQSAEDAASALEALLRPRPPVRPAATPEHEQIPGPPLAAVSAGSAPAPASETPAEEPGSSEYDAERENSSESGLAPEGWVPRLAQALVDRPGLVLGAAGAVAVLAFVLGLLVGRAGRL